MWSRGSDGRATPDDDEPTIPSEDALATIKRLSTDGVLAIPVDDAVRGSSSATPGTMLR